MNRDSRAYLSRTGISNTENIRFNKLHNKFNVFQNQLTTPSTSDGTLSTYVLNNELCFDNNPLTEGGSISSLAGVFEVVNGTITQKSINIYPCQFQDQSISNISLADFGTLTSIIGSITNLYSTTASITSNLFSSTLSSLKGTITDFFSTNSTITSIAVDTVSMSGSTRTITNTAGLSFSGISPYINGVKTCTFSSGSTINDLTTGNIATINSTNVNSTNLYGQQYYIGTSSSNTSLQDYIVNQLGTHSNEQFQNFWVYPSNINYLQLELKNGDSSYPDSGLKTDVLIVNKMAEIENLIAHQFTCTSSGSNLFDFFDTAGNLLFQTGKAYADYKLAKKMLKIGTGALLAVAALSIAGNLIYAIATENSEPSAIDYLNMADEYGCEDSAGNVRYTINDNPIGHPDNSRTLYTFAYNPGFGRLVSAGYTQTEAASDGMGSSNPDTEFVMYAICNGHDRQRSMSFKQYQDVADWNTNARQGTTGAGTSRTGLYMWDRRLCAIDVPDQTSQFTPRLRFNHSDNIIAYKSEIPTATTQFWEDTGSFFQPNLTSGVQGVIQLTSSVFNIYADIYLSGGHQLNFISSLKAHIKYNDTDKTLTFQNGDDTGEFIFNTHTGSAQFKIDTGNNRLELPTGGFFFQESGNQKIRKAGSGVLQISTIDNTEFLVGSDEEKIITLNEPSTWVIGNEYPLITLKDERTKDSVVRTSTQMELVSPNSSGQLYLRCDNGLDGDYTNVFYSRRQGASTGNEYNFFFDTPKTKFNNIQFSDSGAGTLSTGLEYTTNLGGNALLWYNNIILTNDSPNISNRLTFTSITLTNTGLEQNGSDLYWMGSKLNSQSGVSSYFTDDGSTATSSSLDFTFSQDVFVTEQFSTGTINSRINLTASSVNSISEITMCNLKPFVEYNVTAGQQKLNIDFHCGTDSFDNINIRMGALNNIYLKIIPTSTTIYNDLIIDTGENLTLTQGDLTLSNGDINVIGTITSYNISFADMTSSTVGSGLEYTTNLGGNALLWYNSIILTNDSPNISNRLTFTSVTLTNTGLEQNGSDIYWFGSKLNSQTDPYFTDDGVTAESSNLDFSFTQDVSITGETTMKDTLKILSSNIATNYFYTSMSDSSMAFLLTGGSNPDAFYFKDYNSANICKIARNDFTFYGSDTNSKFQITSSEINCYNDIKIPLANIYLQKGNSSTTDDSNFIQLGKWRIQQKIIPSVEYQALKFIWTADTSKGAYILRSRSDGALFTGIHRNAVEKPNPQFELKQGMILISTGLIRNYDKEDTVTIDQTLPILTTSSTPNDKKVFGVFAGQKELVDLYINGNMATEMTPLIPDDRRALINGSGEGAVLVNNENGDIEIGDLIVSSSKLGIGMKQSDDIIRNYSVAKATTSYTFGRYNADQDVLIGCIYLM